MNDVSLKNALVPGTSAEVAEAYASAVTRSLDARFGLDEDEVVVVDTETTDLSPDRGQIIEIAAAILKGPDVIGRFSTLVRPTMRIPEAIVRLTGITDDDVAEAPPIDEAMRAFRKFVGARDLVAHNAGFDRAFIEHYAGGHAPPGRWLDSLQMARVAFPRLKSHRLSDLAVAFGVCVPSHRAGDDVEALVRLWRIMLVGVSDLPAAALQSIAVMHPSVEWSLRPLFAHLAAANGPAALDLKRIRTSMVVSDREPARTDAFEVELEYPSVEEVGARFSADSTVGAMYPGYEPRSEQVDMAREVLGAFASSSHRAIEAGTGVGKSVAYLLPSALFAQRNRVTVGVATKTNALMDQIVHHELPRLSEALEEPVRYVALKGYEHYPCLRKLERFIGDDGSTVDALVMAAVLVAWTCQSTWGDLDSVNLWWRGLPRFEIVATHADCLKSRCKYYPGLCYLHGLRRRASSADIVVTNHALLFRSVDSDSPLLPPIRHWVVDEAHSVESEARDQLSLGIEANGLLAALDALHSKRGGLAVSFARKARALEGGDMLEAPLARLEELAVLVRTIAESFFSYVKELDAVSEPGPYDFVDLWIDDRVRSSGPWSVLESSGRSLQRRMEELLKACKDVVSLAGQFADELTEQRADLSGIALRLAEAAAGLSEVLDGTDSDLVYSARFSRRQAVSREALIAQRVDIGAVLAERFFPETSSVVFTSATIATGESFDHFARSTGLSLLGGDRWSSSRLDSSYDFERNMAIYLPADMPAPSDPAYPAVLERLLYGVHVALGGSVLTLFTNRRDMERVYAGLAPRLKEAGLELIAQEAGKSAKSLRDEFLADERMSLFALKSFWEGFDAPGDTLRCVVIPKLPFGRPTDPLACERSRRERNAWQAYALPEAILELKQAAGRLIRSSTDRGCLILADSRLLEKGYGARFLEALPVDATHRIVWADLFDEIGARFGPDAD